MMPPAHLEHDGVFLECRILVPARANGIGVARSHGWGSVHVFGDLHARSAGRGFTVANRAPLVNQSQKGGRS